MNASTETTDWRSERGKALSVTRDWVAGLSHGNGDAAALIDSIDALIRGDPEAAWDVLSVVDQTYRLGKIESAAFQMIKTHLVRFALGADREHARRPRVPVLQPAADRRLNLTVPVAADPSPPPVTAAMQDAPDRGAAESDLAVGDVLRGRYRITGLLGRGGMGTVFEAVDLDGISAGGGARTLAIKVLHSAVTRRPELFAELRSEFQNLQSLSHPNIVRVHEFDRDGGMAFFTMELLRGLPLAEFVAKDTDGSERRQRHVAIIDAMGAALAHAHQRGIVHGDVNPGNVFLTQGGEVRMLDFGASYKFKPAKFNHALGRDAGRTPVFRAVAAPGYASCQVLEGGTPDVRDDLFAFGCIVYLLLVGKPPYGELTALEARAARATPPRPPDLDDERWRALLETLAFDRDARPSDVREWLARFGRATPPQAPAPQAPAPQAPAPQAPAPQAPAPQAPALQGPAPSGLPARHGLRNLNLALMATTIVLLALFAWWKYRNGGFSELPPDALPARTPARLPAATTTATTNALPEASHDASPNASPNTSPGVLPTAPSSGSPGPAGVVESAPTAPPATPTALPAVASAEPPIGSPVSAAPADTRPAPAAAASDAAMAVHAHIALAEPVLVVRARDPVALVTVLRNGSPEGVASFTWWTAAGTARSGVDFDHFAPHVAKFAAGSRSLDLRIPLHFDAHHRQARNFYVMIAPSAPDFSPVTRHTTMVKIKDAR